jgi:hypothetical protein
MRRTYTHTPPTSSTTISTNKELSIARPSPILHREMIYVELPCTAGPEEAETGARDDDPQRTDIMYPRDNQKDERQAERRGLKSHFV